MNEVQIYELLNGRDRHRYLITGIVGTALIAGAVLTDTVAQHRVAAMFIGSVGAVLLFDHFRRRSREPLARRAASKPKSIVTVQGDPTTPLFLRFADGSVLAPNVTRAEAAQIIGWLRGQNSDIEIDPPALRNAEVRPTGSA